jgi:hypothetical protein
VDYAQEYIQINRPDEAIPALFDNEIKTYHRGFTFGMFGSQNVKTGGGKSIATAAMALEYDKTFNLDRIVFTPADMLKQLSDIERRKLRGAMLICEEVQNYASNRTWFSLYNKTIMHTIATFRHMRAGAFFVTPMARMIDADVQKLMRFGANARLKAVNGALRGYVRVYEVATYNNDKDIARRPIKYYCPESGQVLQMEEARVYMPDRNFVRELEHKIDDYKSQYRSTLEQEAEAFDEAERTLYRRSDIFKPKELAERMLNDSTIINEFANKGAITQGTVAAFYPQLKAANELSAVQKWCEWTWDKLKLKEGPRP